MGGGEMESNLPLKKLYKVFKTWPDLTLTWRREGKGPSERISEEAEYNNNIQYDRVKCFSLNEFFLSAFFNPILIPKKFFSHTSLN